MLAVTVNEDRGTQQVAQEAGTAETPKDNRDRSPRWWQLVLEGGYGTPRPRSGETLEATILSMGEHDIMVDVDGKRDGIVDERDLAQVDAMYLDQLQPGDQIPVRVIRIPFNRSAIVVSLKQGLENQDWIRAQNLVESKAVVEVEVTGVNRGGVVASLGQLQGFIPNSHLASIARGTGQERLRTQKEQLVGESLSVVVIEVNQRRRRLILSEREATAQQADELLQELHEGAIRKGRVSNLVDFGAFIDLGGVDGLLHISEISWDHIDHPRDVLSVGEEIEVYVLDVDRERKRIALSRKRLLPDPWDTVTASLHRGDVIEGTITHITDFGAFIDVGKGVEGLAHVSELPNGEQTLATLTPAMAVKVRVLYVDPLQQRISLRLEEAAPAENTAES